MHTLKVADVRKELKQQLLNRQYVEGRGGATVEIVGAAFLADAASILGEPNEGYIQRELEWYYSGSCNINSFPGGAPSIWRACAAPDGSINSNYGWCVFSKENGSQYHNVIEELRRNPNSRRAVAVYNRPSMHKDATEGGKQDFICTNAVEYFLRGEQLHCVVQMRSSDAVFGYRNDLAWHKYLSRRIASALQVDTGPIYWQAGSLHVYERHFKLLEAS